MPVRHQAVDLASPQHRGAVDQRRPRPAGPRSGGSARGRPAPSPTARWWSAECQTRWHAERRLLVGGAGASRPAMRCRRRGRRSRRRRGRVGWPPEKPVGSSSSARSAESVGVVEPALVLGGHRLEAHQDRVLPDRLGRGPRDGQCPVLGVGLGRGQGEEDRDAQADQVGREALLVTLPGRARRPHPLAVGRERGLGERALPVVVGTPAPGRRRRLGRVEVGGVEDRQQQRGGAGDGEPGVGLDHLDAGRPRLRTGGSRSGRRTPTRATRCRRRSTAAA